jgi:hypothetical protein
LAQDPGARAPGQRPAPVPAPYSPELNWVEHLSDDLRVKCFHNLVLNSIGAPEDRLMPSLLAGDNDPARARSIIAGDRIINALWTLIIE